jgi:hypothetical protein
MLPGRPSLLGVVTTRVNWRTPSTASYLSERKTNSRPLGDEGCPQNGYGTPPGCDGGAEHPSTGRSARDRVLYTSDTTIRGYQSMVEGQASDLYTSDTDTWSATSMIQGSVEEPPIESHSPSGSRSR